MSLTWSTTRCLENSIVEFLTDAIETDGVVDVNNNPIPIYVGRKVSNSWVLPCISVYVDSVSLPRGFIGSNQRLNTYSIIFDIFATNEGERVDLSEWLADAINDGFDYYTYLPNEDEPYELLSTKVGYVSLDFLTNARVALGQNVNLEDSHRQRISIKAWIS